MLKNALKIMAALSLAAVLALAMGGRAWCAPQAVTVQTTPEAGKFLVDAKGMTLYYFVKDSAGKSVCMGDCLGKWPLFHAESLAPGQGLNPGDFGAITRADGAMQTTFRGWPLYYFFQDKVPGDRKGDKVNNVWFVVNPDTLK